MRLWHGSLGVVEVPKIIIPYRLANQFLFHTREALATLSFAGAEEVQR